MIPSTTTISKSHIHPAAALQFCTALTDLNLTSVSLGSHGAGASAPLKHPLSITLFVSHPPRVVVFAGFNGVFFTPCSGSFRYSTVAQHA